MFEIIPAILASSVEDLVKKLHELPGAITFFHMDVLEEDLWSDDIARDFEVHLMVEKPERFMSKWTDRGAKRLIVHEPSVEMAKHRDKAEIGLGVEIDKSLEQFTPFLDFVDFVHLMSIKEIGHQGHPFDEKVFDRIKEIKERFPQLPISVDGGISKDNYQKLIDVGANRLVVGSHFQEVWHLATNK